MKKEVNKHYPKNVEYSDLDRLENKTKFTREYIEKRILNQKGLTSKEKKLLTPELEKYYNELNEKINKLKKGK
jgi:hypothetical protein